jgi:hypothetical protein
MTITRVGDKYLNLGLELDPKGNLITTLGIKVGAK